MKTNNNLPSDPDSLLTETQAAEFVNFSVRALQAWRYRGGGPAFIKISSRAVRYRKSDLTEWTQKHRRISTSDIGG